MNKSKKPPRAVLAALQKVFKAEKDGLLPFESYGRRGTGKIWVRLSEMGLIEPMTKVFGAAWCAVPIRGWSLTQAGRMICEDNEQKDHAA